MVANPPRNAQKLILFKPFASWGGYFLIVAKELKVWFDAIRMPWNKKYNTQQPLLIQKRTLTDIIGH